ncbi:hypothetical protein Lederberg_68 [Pelagibacter phage Lederberg EXVC029P]|nr:hypothetical protein Lederberg_68 [Pelagibacter phage Lederberg EXVC029P]
MTDVAKAIQALNEDNNNSHEFVISGEPSNQAEYERDVKYVSGADANGSAVFSDTQPYTWSQVNTKKSALQTEYNNDQYKRDRADAYPSIQDQLDMQYHDAVDGTTTWKDAIAVVKTANPKPSE